MKTKEVRVRFRYADWKRLRKFFPGIRGESMADYLKRYIKALKGGED